MSEERLETSSGDLASLRRSPWWSVHASRYHFAAGFVHGGRALDVACGTGYGLSILSEVASTVVGVDVDLATVREASLSFKGKPQSVLVADAASLPFESGSFDVVTSLETLEHLDARDRFLAEIRRVLAVTGLCVLSTPNALVTEPIDGKPRNRFHRHEYTPDELATSLRCHFRSVDLVGQALNGRYAIPPFWDDQQRLPRTPTVQARLFGWRVLNKLPFAVRDAISQALWHQPFIPTERDYDFDADVVTAPVLVAICRDFAT